MIDTQPKLKQFNILSEMLMQLFSIQRETLSSISISFLIQRKNIEKNCKIIWSVQKKVVSLHRETKRKNNIKIINN